MKSPHFSCSIIAFFVIFQIGLLSAQENDTLHFVDYNTPKDYEIGGIEVVGAKHSDEKALMAIAGLKVGGKIRIPGEQMQRAMKALLKMRLFADVEINIQKTVGDIVFLEIEVEEQPRLAGFQIKGVKRYQVDELQKLVSKCLLEGTIVTENNRSNAIRELTGFYLEKSFADAAIEVQELVAKDNTIQLIFKLKKGKKVSIQDIYFAGNDQISKHKLTKLLGIQSNKRLFGNSKLVIEELKLGKKAIIAHYHQLGFRDANISASKILRSNQGQWILFFQIEEGNPYYIGNIDWKGNSIYSDAALNKVLGVKNGDIFNEEKLKERLYFSPEDRDVSSIYLDNGFLFFKLELLEKAIRQDTIDLEIRMMEGQQATINKVIINRNDKTKEEVIRRELYTKPGKKFSRADIMRSQRAIMNLGYFNPEKMDLETSVNPELGTVDIIYDVKEMNTDKFEMSAGWSGGVGLTGTVGLSFTNFSVQNIFKKDRWGNLARGDGQQLSLRIQSSGLNYQSYNFSFTEPWLGGKKPNSLTFSGFYNHYATDKNEETGVKPTFDILGLSVGLGSRLRFPDDNFISRTTLNFEKYSLNSWDSGLFTTHDGELVSGGTFYNINLAQTISRNTVNHPIFPTAGSKFSLSAKFTLPYSLFNKSLENEDNPTKKYQFLEYHKWRFEAESYHTVTGKLVLKAYGKMGYLGYYNSKVGTSPFERFQVGGHGIDVAQQGFTGTDAIGLRGYERSDLENNFVDGEEVASSLFTKVGLELRYPISTNPNALIYALTFVEAGNAWQSFNDYKPFDLKRSAGVGFRAHLPMFGTIGMDYSLGLDKVGGWKNNFQLGVILGFEPE
jgi:outer membrane protein insertion porin family